MPYSSSSCFCLLYRTIDICVSCFRAVKIVLGVQCSHTDYWMFDMAPHGKETEDLRIRIVALHKDGLGYKKFGNSLELSWSTVARAIQRFSKIGLTQNRPRKGRSKKLSPCAVRQVQKLASKNRCMSAASIRGRRSRRSAFLWVSFRRGFLLGQWPRRPYGAHCNKSVCMAIVPEGSLFWSWLTKKPANSLLKTTWPRAWITGTMSCGLTQMVSSMCGDALVRRTKQIVPCLQSSMVVVASWSGAAWLLLVLGSCGSLRETWNPTCTLTFWSRRWCSHFRNCFTT